jgi:hypothetical protein
MAAMAANVSCCGTGRKEPGRAGRRRFAELVGQLAELRLLVAAAPAEASSGRVLRHDTVAFAVGTRTESVKLPTRELFGREGATTVPLVKRPERASDDPVGRRRAAQQTWQAAGSHRRDGLHDDKTPGNRG